MNKQRMYALFECLTEYGVTPKKWKRCTFDDLFRLTGADRRNCSAEMLAEPAHAMPLKQASRYYQDFMLCSSKLELRPLKDGEK